MVYTKILFSLLTFTQEVLSYMSPWPNGESAGLPRQRPGFDSRWGKNFVVFFALRTNLVTKKLDFQCFLIPISLHEQRL